MGIYVNPGNTEFRRYINDDIYIDKTGLIEYTNGRLGKASRYLCVSRPRRFGKSMAADMLTAYYSKGCDSQNEFSDLAVAEAVTYKEHINRHNVVRIDIQQFLASRGALDTFIDDISAAVIKELIIEFPDCVDLKGMTQLPAAFNCLFASQNLRFIFIIDEWDCVFRVAREYPEMQKEYLDFLRALFKGAVYVDLAYMTGILPIKKYGEQSAVNMFSEYSMTDPRDLGPFFGFTEQEVRRQCETHSLPFELMEKWYDGYIIGDEHVYNPKSVVDALTCRKFKSYWTGTETYETLKAYIERDFDGLKEAIVEMLGGVQVKIDPATFQNDMTSFHCRDDILTLLVHLGYLTYDEDTGAVFIPNQEVRQEFVRSIKNGGKWGGLFDALTRSEQVLESTFRMDGDAVAEGISKARQDISSIIRYNDENSLSFAVFTAYSAAPAYYMKPVREFPSGRGFADLVYIPRRDSGKPAQVIELKWDLSAEGAIKQIKDKNYAGWFDGYSGDVLLVGINYDKKSDRHQCLIERLDRLS